VGEMDIGADFMRIRALTSLYESLSGKVYPRAE